MSVHLQWYHNNVCDFGEGFFLPAKTGQSPFSFKLVVFSDIEEVKYRVRYLSH